MKRSARMKLLLMGSATLALTACDDTQEVTKAGVYDTVEQCLADGVYSEGYCRDAYKGATEQHAAVAPKYANVQECEADFGPGRCQVAPNGAVAVDGQQASGGGGSFFMPLMTGFLVGQLLNSGGRSYYGQPLYRPYQGTSGPGGAGGWGSYRTAQNVDVGARTGAVDVTRSTLQAPPARTTTISRGGFGARATSVGVASPGRSVSVGG
ncbi:DUF1190 domain-containing protein [Azospirillum sp. RWY-5-1]|uniref:DUF1190 domain-containing protein n=1 Tax=Azospirillum oleiclasticum TaxID=2735135 RepID=A0ABX2T428_9PROT|nr:DUF1190 domain-containing protein [Azospirillum oleiclasticum]NYZ11922.1 DUF1190 domain-containing protein [Azospirillum oleiclasticum]NYZ19082.1 DUF1190 domain-containing protein [Azospirillum oleiclasticum]